MKKLRSEQYCHFKDSLSTDIADNIGSKVIPRYMTERAQDGMSYFRKYDTADLFITFTSNKNWQEINTETRTKIAGPLCRSSENLSLIHI